MEELRPATPASATGESLESLLAANIFESYVELDAGLQVVALNSNAERLLRMSSAEAVGKHLDQVIRDGARSQHWPALLEAIQRRVVRTIAVFHPTQYQWHEVKVLPHRDRTVLLLRDVTDRQWLIRREAERAYLSHVFEDVPVAISLMRGATMTFEYVNKFGRQLVGRDINGRPVREAFPDLEQTQLFDILDQVFKSGQPWQARNMLIRFDRNGDGVVEEGHFDVSYIAVRDFDGSISGVLNMTVEVSPRPTAT